LFWVGFESREGKIMTNRDLRGEMRDEWKMKGQLGLSFGGCIENKIIFLGIWYFNMP
jgi:hypothetical protein